MLGSQLVTQRLCSHGKSAHLVSSVCVQTHQPLSDGLFLAVKAAKMLFNPCHCLRMSDFDPSTTCGTDEEPVLAVEDEGGVHSLKTQCGPVYISGNLRTADYEKEGLEEEVAIAVLSPSAA